MSFSLFFTVFIAYVQFIGCNPINNKFDPGTDIILKLFTRKNPSEFQELKNGNLEILQASNFQLDKPLTVFSHGWSDMPDLVNAPEFVKALLTSSDVNVIVVDWSKGTTGPEEEVVTRAEPIGKFGASLLDWLSTLGLKIDDVHLVGVSLGSHVAGWIGKSVQNGKAGYLTACDPSKRFWDNNPDRVNANDAKYVEIIHSNTASHGLIYPTGTADFYPNGGKIMPGCENDVQQLCSHGRAMEYLVDSIDNQRFVAMKCNNYDEINAGNCANIGTSYMGGMSPKNISGVYYLTTNAEKPYYQG